MPEAFHGISRGNTLYLGRLNNVINTVIDFNTNIYQYEQKHIVMCQNNACTRKILQAFSPFCRNQPRQLKITRTFALALACAVRPLPMRHPVVAVVHIYHQHP